MAPGEGRHSGKALFPECNTRGREALGKEKFVFDGGGKRSRMGNIFPECLTLAMVCATAWPVVPGVSLRDTAAIEVERGMVA
jgi:hypothetical protein